MSVTIDKTDPCLCDEGKARDISISQAESMNFCPGCKAPCSKNTSNRVVLSWFHGKVRLNWKWKDFDVLAYTREQAIKLLRDMVGYHISLSSSDCKLKFMRYLSVEETLKHGCKIKFS